MSLITDDFKPTVNTLEEVKKLQELVRKLEMQNLHLRNKQNATKKRSISPTKELKPSSSASSRFHQKFSSIKTNITAESNVENSTCMRDEYFDELDIIRVSDIEMSDDESWLYISPKSLQQDQNESPYKWLRKDVDDPENQQLQLAKNALLSKLTELDIVSPPNLTASNHAENPTISSLRRSQILYKTPLSAQNHDAIHIDTRTFTRSKKKQAFEFLEKLDMLNSEKPDKNCSSIQLHRKGSDVSSDSVSSCHILEDASDVEEVARMQEESLRMSSPLGTPKRGTLGNNVSLRKISTSSRGSISDQDLSESSIVGAPAIEDCSGQEVIESNSYMLESLSHSDQSSPSESPYSSNISLHSSEKVQGKLSGYRRSLPNLTRETLAVRQSKISHNAGVKQSQIKSTSIKKTDFQNNQKTRKEYTSPLRVRHTNQASSLSNCQSSSSTVENVTLVPRSAETAQLRVRSGLPRPSRASSASRSAPRSGIPTPSLYSKKQVEDSWSEGCF